MMAAATFSTAHILITGLISGALAACLAAWRLHSDRLPLDWLAIGVLTAAAVFLFRKSANMPQLNSDGLQGFSANDWLAPTVAFVALSLYSCVRPGGDTRRFGQARALATVDAFAVNVITI